MFQNKSDFTKEEEHINTVFGPETDFEGTVRYKSSLIILGKFRGTIETPGLLVIGEGAEVDADVSVGNIIIRGNMKGNIEAMDTTSMMATARVSGDIRTGRLNTAEGVIWEGRCEMING